VHEINSGSYFVHGPKEMKKENTVAKAKARHILVSSQEACEDLKQQIENGQDFAEMA